MDFLEMPANKNPLRSPFELTLERRAYIKLHRWELNDLQTDRNSALKRLFLMDIIYDVYSLDGAQFTKFVI